MVAMHCFRIIQVRLYACTGCMETDAIRTRISAPSWCFVVYLARSHIFGANVALLHAVRKRLGLVAPWFTASSLGAQFGSHWVGFFRSFVPVLPMHSAARLPHSMNTATQAPH